MAPGTLPHEAPAGKWKVYDSKWATQPAAAVRGVTKAEADRLEAEAGGGRGGGGLISDRATW